MVIVARLRAYPLWCDSRRPPGRGAAVIDLVQATLSRCYCSTSEVVSKPSYSVFRARVESVHGRGDRVCEHYVWGRESVESS